MVVIELIVSVSLIISSLVFSSFYFFLFSEGQWWWLLGGFPCRLHTVAHFIEAMCHASMLQDVRFHRVMQTLEDDFDDVRTEI